MGRQTQRAVVAHQPDGEMYIIECEADWDSDGNCIGGHITLANGPIVRSDLVDEETWLAWTTTAEHRLTEAEIAAHRAVFDRIDHWQGLTTENAEWLQAEEDAGRLTYPIGAR